MTQKIQRFKIKWPDFYEAQLAVFNHLLTGSQKYTILNGGRQVGKSFLLIYAAIAWAMSEPSQLVMCVSPTDGQVIALYERMMSTLKGAPFLLSDKSSKGSAEVVFKNDSRIIFRSSKSEDSLRGHALDYLVGDEVAFWKESVWNTILAPSLSVRGKRVLLCSTPRGRNFFYRLFMNEQLGLPNYKSFKINYTQNPFAKVYDIEQERVVLPIEVFNQEYLGEFTDSAAVFKHTLELATLRRSQPEGQDCVIGIDIAMVRDFTVAVCLDRDGNMLDYIRFNKLEMSASVNRLEEFIRLWNPKRTIVETNNQGFAFISSLREKGLHIEPFTTSPSSKQQLIQELIASFNKKEVRILNDETVISEFNDFTYKVSDTGTLRFEAASGHDDVVMATAFALRARRSFAVGELFIY